LRCHTESDHFTKVIQSKNVGNFVCFHRVFNLKEKRFSKTILFSLVRLFYCLLTFLINFYFSLLCQLRALPPTWVIKVVWCRTCHITNQPTPNKIKAVKLKTCNDKQTSLRVQLCRYTKIKMCGYVQRRNFPQMFSVSSISSLKKLLLYT
jgi:hypothetical protein